jgi:hypothetical protein
MASKDFLTNTQRFQVSNNPLTAMNTEIKLTSPKPQVKYFEGDLNDKEKKQVVMKLIRFLKTS